MEPRETERWPVVARLMEVRRRRSRHAPFRLRWTGVDQPPFRALCSIAVGGCTRRQQPARNDARRASITSYRQSRIAFDDLLPHLWAFAGAPQRHFVAHAVSQRSAILARA